MRCDQLEHLIRAVGALIEDDTVIGSQAILATVPAPAEEALIRSMEAHLLPLDDPLEEKADLIDGVCWALDRCSTAVTEVEQRALGSLVRSFLSPSPPRL